MSLMLSLILVHIKSSSDDHLQCVINVNSIEREKSTIENLKSVHNTRTYDCGSSLRIFPQSSSRLIHIDASIK